MKNNHSRGLSEKPVYRTHQFALGVLTAAIISIGLWLISDPFVLSSLRSEAIDAIPAIGALFVALLSLFMSYSALSEQRRARQASTDPVILVHFGHREDAPSLVTLEVSNVGAGAAVNVSFRLDDEAVAALLADGSVITDFREITGPIRTVPQDRSISYNFGLGFKLCKEPFSPPIRVIVSYGDIDGGVYTSEQWLDVRELRWQRADLPAEARTAKALEELAKHTKKIAADGHEFRVVYRHHSELRAQEEVERINMLEMIRKAKNKELE
jgi:hypothetical protein